MSKRSIWHKPKLRTEEESGKHRKVSWLELFYDLFFVVTISQLAHTLVGDISTEKILNYLFMFLPVWWIWIGTTYYLERFETEGLENRIFLFLLLLPITGMAVSIHDGLGATSFGLGLSYLSGRTIITFLWLRGAIHDKQFRATGIKYTIGFSLSLILFAISLFVEPPLRFALWGAAFVIDLTTPWFTLKDQAKLPRLSTSRLPERFGLLILIVLGESAVGVVNGLAENHNIEYKVLLAALLALGVSFGFWWTYFDFIGRRYPKPNIYSNIIWSYTHLPLAMAIASFGASVTNIIGVENSLSNAQVYHVSVSAALTFIVIGILEFTLKRNHDEPTHKIYSPLLKFLTGFIILLIPITKISFDAVTLLTVVMLTGLINAVYGAYVWFHMEIEQEISIH